MISFRRRFVVPFVTSAVLLASCSAGSETDQEAGLAEEPASVVAVDDGIVTESETGEGADSDPTLEPATEVPDGDPLIDPIDETYDEIDDEADDETDDTAWASRLPFAPEDVRTYWEGTLGDSETSLWLARRGDHLRGELVETADGQPSMLLGTQAADSEFAVVRQYGSDGRVAGTLTLTATSTLDLAGQMDDRELSVRQVSVDDAPDLLLFNPGWRPGLYGYSFAPFGDDGKACCGPVGSLWLTESTNRLATIQFENVGGGPGFSQALFGPVEVAVDPADPYHLSVEGDECAFRVTAYNGFAFVDHLDAKYDCGFGNGAGIEGVYLLIEPGATPESSLTFADESDTDD